MILADGKPFRATRGQIMTAARDARFPEERAMIEADALLQGLVDKPKVWRPPNVINFLREGFAKTLADMAVTKSRIEGKLASAADARALPGPEDRDLEQIFRQHNLGRIGGPGGMNVTGSLVKAACTSPTPIDGLVASEVQSILVRFIAKHHTAAPDDAVAELRRDIAVAVLIRRFGRPSAQVNGPCSWERVGCAMPASLHEQIVGHYRFSPAEARLARGELLDEENYIADRSRDPDAYLLECAEEVAAIAVSIACAQMPTDTETLLSRYGRDLQSEFETRVREAHAVLLRYGREHGKSAADIDFKCVSNPMRGYREIASMLGVSVPAAASRPAKRRKPFN